MSPAPLYEHQNWLLVRAPRLAAEEHLGGDEAQDDALRLAIAVASRSLLDALNRPGVSEREAARTARKVLRYRIRMSTRPTPYGMFAGVALGRFADATDLELSDEPVRTRTRADMEWLLDLATAQEARADIRRHLRLVANPSAFERAGRMWLSEQAPVNGRGAEPGVSVRATRPVRAALAAARRLVAYCELKAMLVASTGAGEERVEALLDQLWRETFLLTELRPPLTTADPTGHVTAVLDTVPEAGEAANELRRAQEAARRWDASPPAQREAALADLAAAVGDAFQVDMALPLSGRGVSRRVGSEAAAVAEVLLRLTAWPAGPPYLAGFRQAFEARYPDGRAVPLPELVDPDHGLGSPSSWPSAGPSVPAPRAARRALALTDLALGALRDRSRAVALDAELLSRLETWTPTPSGAPPSIEINVFVAAASGAAVDEGDFRLVVGPNVGGSGAGKNLGRFADLLGPEAYEALQGSARAEEASAPDRIWAELAYCPRRFRSANVAVRPAVRSHEIVLAVSAGVEDGHVIRLDELLVSVRDGRFVLHWSQTGAEVVVCAGHMLNTVQAPEVCRFLTDLAKDGHAQLGGFDWGPAAAFPFLPRVEVGRSVLSLARWNVGSAMRTGELRPADRVEFADSQQLWRERWDVPRHVYMSEGDNRLLLDLDAPAHVEELRQECLRAAPGGRPVVEEVLPGFDDLWLRGPSGRYFCELVVPLLRRPGPVPSAAAAAVPAPTQEPAAAASRLRPPGSEWLYVKLYGARSLADDLLVRDCRPFLADVLARGLADAWFFIRYSDPGAHLRLRFRGQPDRLVGSLLPDICTWASGLLERGICDRFAFDTYERELDRFGGDEGAGLAEAVFAVESAAALELLALARDLPLDLDAVAIATMAVDNLLSGLGLDEPARTRWYERTVTWGASVGAEYRRRKGQLRTALGGEEPGGPAIATVLADARRALAPLGRALDDAHRAGRLAHPPETLYRSFVHLQCNRLLGSARAKEHMVLGLALRTRRGLERHPVA